MLRNGDDLGSSHPRKLRAVHIANKGNEGGTIKAAIDGEELSPYVFEREKKAPSALSFIHPTTQPNRSAASIYCTPTHFPHGCGHARVLQLSSHTSNTS